MFKKFHRMSWPVTFIIPVVLGSLVVVAGVTQPQLPRSIFIVSFIFIMVFLPGILVAAKLLSAPRETMDVVLERIEPHGYVTLRLEDGRTGGYQAHAMNREVLMGKLREGEKLRVTAKGDIVINYERRGHDVDYWPEQTDP